MVAAEIAAKHGDLQQVSGERGPLEARSGSGRVDPVERSDLGKGENVVGRGVWPRLGRRGGLARAGPGSTDSCASGEIRRRRCRSLCVKGAAEVVGKIEAR